MSAHGFLTIRLLSDTSTGTGEAEAHDVDLTVVTDRLGRPFLPRHRLLAALRQAVRAQVLLAYPDSAAVFDALLGVEKRIEGGSLLRLDHGVLPQRAAGYTETWRRQNLGVPTRAEKDRYAWRLAERLAERFTELREQTAVDQDGAPFHGSLRAIRVLPAGLVFIAPFALDEAGPEQLAALARGCLALRELGGKTSRGFGQVEVLISGDRELTAELAFADAARAARRAVTPREAGGRLPGIGPVGGIDVSAAQPLDTGLQLTVAADFVLTTELRLADGDLATPGTVPGSAIRGALSARLRGEPLHDRLVVSGAVQFGAGRLLAKDPAAVEAVPLLPAPLSLRADAGRRLVDTLSESGDDLPASWSEDLDHPPALLTADRRWGSAGPLVRIEQRVNTNREPPLYFENTVWESGQTLRLSFVLTAADGAGLQLLAADLVEVLDRAPLLVGGGRPAYGGGLRRSSRLLVGPETLLSAGAGEQPAIIDVVAATPVLARDGLGEFGLEGFAVEVLALLQKRAGLVGELVGSAVAPTAIGGRNARFTGPRPTHPAAAAGSVLRIALRGRVDAAVLSALPHHRLGERTVDGYGEWFWAIAGQPGVRPEAATRDELVSGGLPPMLDPPAQQNPAWSAPVIARLDGDAVELPDGPELDAVPEAGDVARATLLDIRFRITLLGDTSIAAEAELAAGKQTNRLKLARAGRGSEEVLLRGSTLAGLLRHHLAEQLGGGEASSAMTRSLFGGVDGDRLVPSSLAFFDAAFHLPTGIDDRERWRARIGVRQDPSDRSQQVALFETETLPAGSTVDCRIVARPPGRGTALTEVRAAWLSALAAALDGLVAVGDAEAAEIAVGAFTSTGSGRLQSGGFTLHAVDTTDSPGFEAWFRDRHPAPGPGAHLSLADALAAAGIEVEPPASQAERLQLRLELRVAEPERIGGPVAPGRARPATLRHGDVSLDPKHGSKGNQAELLRRPRRDGDGGAAPIEVDSGPGLKHALKATALAVAEGIAGTDPDARTRARELVVEVFGSFFGDSPALPSRVRVDEPLLVGDSGLRLGEKDTAQLSRIRIDPLTQGSIVLSRWSDEDPYALEASGALFTDRVVAGGGSVVTLTLARPDAASRGLLWAVLREYAQGRGTATGGGVGVGHGRRLLAEVFGDGVPALEDWPRDPGIAADYEALVARIRKGEPR